MLEAACLWFYISLRPNVRHTGRPVLKGLGCEFLQYILADLHSGACSATEDSEAIIQVCNADIPTALDGQLQGPVPPLQAPSLYLGSHLHWQGLRLILQAHTKL